MLNDLVHSLNVNASKPSDTSINTPATKARQLIDQHMVPHIAQQNSRDKPWVNDNFRYLIRRRQFTWRNGRTMEYRKFRNKVQYAARHLRKKYYNQKLQNLRRTDSRRWWLDIKELIGQSGQLSQLTNLANQ